MGNRIAGEIERVWTSRSRCALALLACGCASAQSETSDSTGTSTTESSSATSTSASTDSEDTTDADTSAGTTLPGSDGGTSSDETGVSDSTDTGSVVPPAKIFVTLVSHNEDTATGGNAECVAFFDAIDERYEANRAAVLAIADVVVARGAAWDFQSDVEYLQIVRERESDADNVVRTLAELAPDRIVVDAHAHESFMKNYADVANLVEQVSGARTGVIGGFTAAGCSPDGPQPDWEKFRMPIAPVGMGGGDVLDATVITGGASAGHLCDPAVSGVWRPSSHDMFLVDDPRQELPTIGTGLASAGGLDGELESIATLLDDLHAGRLEAGRMYTSSVTISHCSFDLEGSGVTVDDVAAFIDGVQEIGGDDVEWATFSGIVEIWRDAYAEQPAIWAGE